MQKMQEIEQLANVQGLPTDRNTLNKLMALHPGLSNQMNSTHPIVGRGALSGPAQAALALNNYQNLLIRQNSMNSNPNSHQQEASSSMNNANQSPSSSFQGPVPLLPGSMSNSPMSGFPSPHIPSQQSQQAQQPHLLQTRSLSSNSLLQQSPQSSQGNQAMQQHQMIQQLLQEMSSNNSGGGLQQSFSGGQNPNGSSMARNGMGFGNNLSAAPASASNVSGNVGPVPSRSNSFKGGGGGSNSESTVAGGNNGFNQKSVDMPSNLPLQDDIVQDIANDFTENGFFNGDLDENIWKA